MGNCCGSLASPTLLTAEVAVWPMSETFLSESSQRTCMSSQDQDLRRDKMADKSSPFKTDDVTMPMVPLVPQPPTRIHSSRRRSGGGAPSGLARSVSVDTPSQSGTATPSPCRLSRSASASLVDNVQRAKPIVKRGPFGILPSALQFTSRTDQQMPVKAKGSDDSDKRQCLKPTLQSMICDDSRYSSRHCAIKSYLIQLYRFRILVLGKVRDKLLTNLQVQLTRAMSQRDSGKSSLINAAFKVDMSVRTPHLPILPHQS